MVNTTKNQQVIEFTRLAETALTDWNQTNYRKPLLIRGARQVGKSFLVRKWANRSIGSDKILEINLEEQPRFRE
jgi:predicted AAA+ superfamily ATPase